MSNSSFTQEIAVFGQSGSGKTVLLSSLYGRTWYESDKKRIDYQIHCKATKQHTTLLANYYRMRDEDKVPMATRFEANEFEFELLPQNVVGGGPDKVKRLTVKWHDYPGEWFERDPESDTEALDRSKTFRRLLGANVALFLVDGQKLKDNAGQEERYLKQLFASFKHMLLSLKDEILVDGGELEQFPRVWIIALSKADLLPDITVDDFLSLMMRKADSEINALRDVIQQFITHDEAVSIGEDFVLLSCAEFTPGKIDTTETKGLSALLPIATVLPIEDFLNRDRFKVLPWGFLDRVGALEGADKLVGAIARVVKWRPLVKKLPVWWILGEMVADLLPMATEALEAEKEKALQQHDFYRAILTEFTKELNMASEAGILKRGL